MNETIDTKSVHATFQEQLNVFRTASLEAARLAVEHATAQVELDGYVGDILVGAYQNPEFKNAETRKAAGDNQVAFDAGANALREKVNAIKLEKVEAETTAEVARYSLRFLIALAGGGAADAQEV